MQAPARFSRRCARHWSPSSPALRPAAVRARFDLRERGDVGDLVDVLDRVGRVGAAPTASCSRRPTPGRGGGDRPAARPRHTGRHPGHGRASLRRGSPTSGLDNDAAGATAAYLLSSWLGILPGDVLVTVSRSSFFGERERRDAFVARMADHSPGRALVEVGEGDGLDETTAAAVREALCDEREIAGVYSIGGGNRAIATSSPEPAASPTCSSATTSTATTCPAARRHVERGPAPRPARRHAAGPAAGAAPPPAGARRTHLGPRQRPGRHAVQPARTLVAGVTHRRPVATKLSPVVPHLGPRSRHDARMQWRQAVAAREVRA